MIFYFKEEKDIEAKPAWFNALIELLVISLQTFVYTVHKDAFPTEIKTKIEH